MLKETETEETIGIVSSFLSLAAFNWRWRPGPLGYAYVLMITEQVCAHTNHKIWHNQTAKKIYSNKNTKL